MTLTDHDRLILLAAQFRCDASVEELHKLTRLRVHTIQYRLARLRQEGVIRKGAFINIHRLGLEEYQIHFTLFARSESLRTKVLDFLKADSLVIWVGELGATYHYGVTVCGKSVNDAHKFLERLAGKFGSVFIKKTTAVVVSRFLFQKRYLTLRPYAWDSDVLALSRGSKAVVLDETDHKILGVISSNEWSSSYDIARQSGIPRTTVDYRIKQLVHNGVIGRFVYFISASKLGMISFKLLLFARGIHANIFKPLYAFCKRERNIISLIHTFGSWDFELGVEAKEARDVTALVQRLYGALGEVLNDIEIVPVFEQTTSRQFLSSAL